MFSPIAIPVVTVVLLLTIAYILLRPPSVSVSVDASAIPAGGSATLTIDADRAVGVSFDPPINTQTDNGQSQVTCTGSLFFSSCTGKVQVNPDRSTTYNVTRHNWILFTASFSFLFL
jgi:hypothetical protein